jgi:periplasmic nitrate reductase NapD
MNVSGILVVVPPSRVEDTKARLESLPGVEVHHVEPESGRIVVVQEAASVDEEVAALGRIKTMNGVMLAEMVYHLFDETPPEWDPLPPELERA